MDHILASVLNGFSDAAFLLDRNRRVVAANAAGKTAFGVGGTGRDFVWHVRQPDCLRLIDEVIDGAPHRQIIVELTSPVRGYYQITAAQIAGEIEEGGACVIVSFADVSHIREAEQMRADFVANVSHELRSPLTALSGFIETLSGPAKGDEAATDRFLDLMGSEAQRMTRLIADLLQLSKVENQERVRPTARIDLRQIVERVIATLSHQAQKDGVPMTLNAPATTAFPVQGDEDELTQVFHNLIENALKYGGEENHVAITLSTLPTAPGMMGGAIKVSVRDTGPGIERVHQARLTERFYRVDTGRSRDKGGTGLGLAIVKHILQRHRGRLTIDSRPGQGSDFAVFIPVIPSA
ncbi:MAG: sensor histidine kinase [Pikeienuella sp.]